MFDLIVAWWLSYKTFVSDKATNAAAAWNSRDRTNFITEFVLLLLAVLAPIAGMAILLLAAYRLRNALVALVMLPILVASYRVNHTTNAGNIDDGDDEKTPYDRALELYPAMLRFMFLVMVSASSSTVIDCKCNVRDIVVTLPTGKNFSMENGVAIYPFEVAITDEITLEEADELRDELQRIGRNYISEFPQLISNDAKKRDPFEVLAVHPLGRRIHVDVVQTTSTSISMIDECRKARAKRKNNPAPLSRYIDPIYGDNEDGTNSLLR